MKLRRFSGATTAQAIARVKAALGPDAIILDTAAVAGEVTVTAAVDELPAAPPPRPGPLDGELAAEVRQLLGVVRELVEDQWRHQVPGLGPELVPLQRALVAQGVDAVIAAALVQATARRLDAGTPLDAALAGTLGASVDDTRRVRFFLGPPGDGKTTTIAKLAAQARRAGRRVALVSTDTYRIGAVAELETYGRALGAPCTAAADAGELRRALAAAAGADLVLVDTAGAGPDQERELAELAALVTVGGTAAGRTLVASAATGSRAACRTYGAFAALAPDACVLTKLDVGPAGPMLGVLWRAGVPVSHVAAGRRIPDDLEPATSDRLARCLLAA